jgi:tripartite-type tricarboxylate transporter receptor subunit TctC
MRLSACAGVWMAAGIASTLPSSAISQSFPLKPVRIVTQYEPGSSGDLSLRIVAPVISKSWGQPVVIDNRPGAGGILAAEQVHRSEPDGYTLAASSSALYLIRPFLVKTMPFDPAKDFTPVTLYQEAITFLVAQPSLAPNSIKELLDYARTNPGKVAFGTSGIGTEGHLAGEEIMELAGIKMTHVPYKSSALALRDVVSGQLQTSFSIYVSILPFLNAGKIKVLAVVKDARSPRLPDVPAIAEAIPGFEAPASWTGIFGPAGMPPALARRIQSEFARAAKEPETAARLAEGGFDVVASTPEEFSARMRREFALIARLVKAAGIKPE